MRPCDRILSGAQDNQSPDFKTHCCKTFTCQSSFVDGVQGIWLLSRQTFRMSEDMAVIKGICMVDELRTHLLASLKKVDTTGSLVFRRHFNSQEQAARQSVCHMKSEPFSVVFSLTTELPCQCETHLKDSGDKSFAERGAKPQDRDSQSTGPSVVVFLFQSLCVQDDGFQQYTNCIQCIWGQCYRWLAL